MVRVNRLLILVAACGLTACEPMGTEPTLDAPTGMGRTNDNGSQFADNFFTTLGGFSDDQGDFCSINWGDETDRNDFLRTDPNGDRALHVAGDTDLYVVADGAVWTGQGQAAGIAKLGSPGLSFANFTASGKVTNDAGEEGQAVCHIIVEDNVYTKTDIDVN